MCLERCEKEVREQVTLYLQQTPHTTQQPLLLLLHYQGLRMQQKDVTKRQSDTTLIVDHMKTESKQMVMDHHQNHEEIKAVKRRRESTSLDEEILDVNKLFNSLNDSCKLVKKIKESNVFIDDEDSKMVKDILEDMLNVWTAGESKVVVTSNGFTAT